MLSLTGNITSIATGSRNFTLRGPGNGRSTGTISDGSGVVGIIKSGSGTWTLEGGHSFTGPVSIQEGTLTVHESASPEPVNVLQGADPRRRRNVGQGRYPSPASIPLARASGTQTVDGPLDYQNTARIDWEITSQSLTADKIEAVNVTAAPGAVVIIADSPGGSVDFKDPFWRVPQQWPVLTCDTLVGSFTLGALPADSQNQPSQPFGGFSLVQTISGGRGPPGPRPAIPSVAIRKLRRNVG